MATVETSSNVTLDHLNEAEQHVIRAFVNDEIAKGRIATGVAPWKTKASYLLIGWLTMGLGFYGYTTFSPTSADMVNNGYRHSLTALVEVCGSRNKRIPCQVLAENLLKPQLKSTEYALSQAGN